MLRRESAALVVIDVQTRLLPQIYESEQVVRQIVRLIRGFQILKAPVLVTEQYRKGLGPTHRAIQHAASTEPDPADPFPAIAEGGPENLEGFHPIEKMTFSCAEHPPFLEELEALDRRQLVLCGIEAHVCVLQTALNLIQAGFDTYIAADAISSRDPRNVEIALRRMERAGAVPTSVEMGIFEMLHACGTDEFKEWLKFIR